MTRLWSTELTSRQAAVLKGITNLLGDVTAPPNREWIELPVDVIERILDLARQHPPTSGRT